MKKRILSKDIHHIVYPGLPYSEEDEKAYNALSDKAKELMDINYKEPSNYLYSSHNTSAYDDVNGTCTIYVENNKSYEIQLQTDTNEYVEMFIYYKKVDEKIPIDGKVSFEFKFSDITMPSAGINLEFRQANKKYDVVVTTEEHYEKENKISLDNFDAWIASLSTKNTEEYQDKQNYVDEYFENQIKIYNTNIASSSTNNASVNNTPTQLDFFFENKE